MIRIIDATLSLLDSYDLNKKAIFAFIELMGEIGIKSLQISINTYYTMEGELPEGFQYYLEVDTASYMNCIYPSHDKEDMYFFVPKEPCGKREIATYHINGMEDPFKRGNVEKNALRKVVGLDNLILGGAAAGILALKKEYDLSRLFLCPEDTYHCATAIALLFLQNKGYAVISSMLGIENKAATEQILLALHVLERYMVNKSFKGMVKIRDWLEKNLKIDISPMAPILGRRIFCVESGIHVDGILKKPTNYEPYAPELVGLSREIVLGKHSGRNSVSYKMNELQPGIKPGECCEIILEEVKYKSRTSGKRVTDDEFMEIVERVGRHEENT
ncbi:MAG: hypothetical protein QM697_15420 [Lachnospiraceae bacterium]